MSQPLLALLVVGWTYLLIPTAAQAYIGPGAGLTAIGSLLGLIAAIGMAIFGLLWFPIKSYRRKRWQAIEEAPVARAPGPLTQKETTGEKSVSSTH
jgi:hypothetical protein